MTIINIDARDGEDQSSVELPTAPFNHGCPDLAWVEMDGPNIPSDARVIPEQIFVDLEPSDMGRSRPTREEICVNEGENGCQQCVALCKVIEGEAVCVDDECPDDPNKTQPGVCGCGTPDLDTDGDGYPDCRELCPNDPNKIFPQDCGCGIDETDADGDGVPWCNDQCEDDPNKTEEGLCGCGFEDHPTCQTSLSGRLITSNGENLSPGIVIEITARNPLSGETISVLRDDLTGNSFDLTIDFANTADFSDVYEVTAQVLAGFASTTPLFQGPVDLSPQRAASELKFLVSQDSLVSEIHGTIRKPDGSPLPLAEVKATLFKVEQGQVVVIEELPLVTSALDGSYSTPALKGKYFLEVTHPAFELGPDFPFFPIPERPAPWVTVAPTGLAFPADFSATNFICEEE